MERFVLDATAPIIFGNNGRWDVLEAVIAGRATVSEEVYGECRSVRGALDASLSSGTIQMMRVSGDDNLKLYAEARDVMDGGEASSIVLAEQLDAVLISDDLEVIRRGPSLASVRILGVAGVLCFAVAHELLTAAQARVLQETFIAGGARLPDPAAGAFDECSPSH